MNARALLLLAVAAVAPLRAFDDQRGRIGLQIDYTKRFATDTVGNLGTDLKPLGSQDTDLVGLGLVGEWRLGKNSYTLRHFSLVPSLSFRYGTAKDGGDITRRTKEAETTLALPVRWYTGDGGQHSEGFFLEAGPQGVRTEQKTTLDGLSDPSRIAKNRFGWTAGFGGAFVAGETTHLVAGIAFVRTAAAETQFPTKGFRLYFQLLF